MMIVVVMLSSAADMKKVMNASSHISLCLLRVLMWSVMTLLIFSSCPQRLKIVHMAPHISSAMADLSTLTLCSSAMKA